MSACKSEHVTPLCVCVCVCVCVLDMLTVFFCFSPVVVYCTCVRTQLVPRCILRACNFRRRLINQADLPRPVGVLQHGQRSSQIHQLSDVPPQVANTSVQ